MLSARDVERVLRWARAGYPLHIVTEIIQARMQVAPPRVRGLAYVATAVEEAVASWMRLREGEPTGAAAPATPASEGWTGLLDQLVSVGQAADEPAKSVLRVAWRLTRDAQSRCAADPTIDPVEHLAEVEAELEGVALEALDLDIRQLIEARVDLELAAERRIAAPEAFAETRRAHVWRAVRRRLGIPRLRLMFAKGAP